LGQHLGGQGLFEAEEHNRRSAKSGHICLSSQGRERPRSILGTLFIFYFGTDSQRLMTDAAISGLSLTRVCNLSRLVGSRGGASSASGGAAPAGLAAAGLAVAVAGSSGALFVLRLSIHNATRANAVSPAGPPQSESASRARVEKLSAGGASPSSRRS